MEYEFPESDIELESPIFEEIDEILFDIKSKLSKSRSKVVFKLESQRSDRFFFLEYDSDNELYITEVLVNGQCEFVIDRIFSKRETEKHPSLKIPSRGYPGTNQSVIDILFKLFQSGTLTGNYKDMGRRYSIRDQFLEDIESFESSDLYTLPEEMIQSSDLSALPEEMIQQICLAMDDITLLNFVRSTKQHYRICSEILDHRNEIHFTKIDSIIDAIELLKKEKKNIHLARVYIELESSTVDRIFILRLHYLGKFDLFEVIIDPQCKFIIHETSRLLQKRLTYGETKGNLRLILLKLFQHGILTGNYKLLSRESVRGFAI